MPSMSEAAPRVTVIVLTYNRVAMLPATLDAILGQTEADIEVLVVDNESEDGTSEFVASLAEEDPRVRYTRHQNGGNLSVNRNWGISLARGEWVAFCDDDDLWLPEKLERQLAEADAHPDAGIVSTNAIYFANDPDTGDEIVYGTLVECSEDGWVTREDLFSSQRTQVVLSSAMVRREAFEQVGPWDEDPGVFAIEDLQYWIRSTTAGVRIRRLCDSLVRYRIHPGAVSAPDTRVTARKQLYMIGRLRERGVLDEPGYEEAHRAFRRKLRNATYKEWLKKVPGLKAAVYDSRRRSSAAAPGPKEHQ